MFHSLTEGELLVQNAAKKKTEQTKQKWILAICIGMSR